MAGRSPTSSEHDHDHGSLLRAAGLRVTPVRLGVLAALCATHEVLSADQIIELVSAKRGSRAKGRKPDRVTVYRTLNALVDAGIAHRMDPGDRVFRFGLTGEHATHTPRQGGDCGCGASDSCEHAPKPVLAAEPGHGHPHFVCDSCGKVECLDETEVVLKTRPGKGSPKTVRRQEVLLRGTCGSCEDGPAQ